MPEPEFDGWSRDYKRMMRHEAQDLKATLKEMKHHIRDAERGMRHEMRDAIKYEARRHRYLYRYGWADEPVPRSADEVLEEIDSYLSYLEDLPKEKLAPYGNEVDGLIEHLGRVRSALKGDPGAK